MQKQVQPIELRDDFVEDGAKCLSAGRNGRQSANTRECFERCMRPMSSKRTAKLFWNSQPCKEVDHGRQMSHFNSTSFSPDRTCFTVLLSPHRDDVAFSLSTQVDVPLSKLAVNLFTRTRYTAARSLQHDPTKKAVDHVTAIRALEDRHYFNRVNLAYVDFDGEEPDLRGRQSRDPTGTEDDAAQIRTPLRALLTELVDTHQRVTVVAPAAIGGHVNHLAARKVAFEWYLDDPENRGIGFYEDLPYAARWRTRHVGITALKAFVGGRRIVRKTYRVPREKLDGINLYASQQLQPVTRLSTFSPAAFWPPYPHEAIWEIA